MFVSMTDEQKIVLLLCLLAMCCGSVKDVRNAVSESAFSISKLVYLQQPVTEQLENWGPTVTGIPCHRAVSNAKAAFISSFERPETIQTKITLP